MSWLFFALLAAALYGVSNIIDGYLTNTPFKKLRTLVCFGAVIPVVFVPVLWIISPPAIPPLAYLPHILIIGLINIAYLYPYYHALQKDDVSVVTSLFTLGRIFVPILAFLFVGEVLTVTQYSGFAVIITASVLLTLNGGRHPHFSKSLPAMALTSGMLSIEAVLFKLMFEDMSWSTGFIWPTLVTAVCGLILFAIDPRVRKEIRLHLRKHRKSLILLGAEELSTFTASALGAMTISLAPVTLVEAVFSVEPFFILCAGLALKRLIPIASHESSGGDARILKKILLFALMIVGVLLVGGAR